MQNKHVLQLKSFHRSFEFCIANNLRYIGQCLDDPFMLKVMLIGLLQVVSVCCHSTDFDNCISYFIFELAMHTYSFVQAKQTFFKLFSAGAFAFLYDLNLLTIDILLTVGISLLVSIMVINQNTIYKMIK